MKRHAERRSRKTERSGELHLRRAEVKTALLRIPMRHTSADNPLTPQPILGAMTNPALSFPLDLGDGGEIIDCLSTPLV